MSAFVKTAERATLHDWLARPFGSVRPGEGLKAGLMAAALFLILTSYYLLKTSREGLILTCGAFGLRGEELEAYAGGALAIVLVVLVPAYGTLASRVSRLRLINVSYAIVIGSLLVLFALALGGLQIGVAFFVWIGVISLFAITQFWAYAADLYDQEQGQRLFAMIAIGGSLGAVVGPEIAEHGTTFALIPLAALLLAGCVVVLNVVERHDAAHRVTRPRDAVIDGPRMFDLVIHDRSMLLIAALVLIAELVKSNGDYVLSAAVARHAAAAIPATTHAELAEVARAAAVTADRREWIRMFYAHFDLWVNAIACALQVVAVSTIIARLGVGRALFVMPVIALGAYGLIGAIGGISLVRAAKATENASGYSLQNTVRQTLFLSSGRSTKYKAKAAIDTLVVRMADSLSALCVWFLVHQLGVAGRGVSCMNLGLVVAWLAIAVAIVRRRRRLGLDPSRRRAA